MSFPRSIHVPSTSSPGSCASPTSYAQTIRLPSVPVSILHVVSGGERPLIRLEVPDAGNASTQQAGSQRHASIACHMVCSVSKAPQREVTMPNAGLDFKN